MRITLEMLRQQYPNVVTAVYSSICDIQRGDTKHVEMLAASAINTVAVNITAALLKMTLMGLQPVIELNINAEGEEGIHRCFLADNKFFGLRFPPGFRDIVENGLNLSLQVHVPMEDIVKAHESDPNQSVMNEATRSIAGNDTIN